MTTTTHDITFDDLLCHVAADWDLAFAVLQEIGVQTNLADGKLLTDDETDPHSSRDLNSPVVRLVQQIVQATRDVTAADAERDKAMEQLCRLHRECAGSTSNITNRLRTDLMEQIRREHQRN